MLFLVMSADGDRHERPIAEKSDQRQAAERTAVTAAKNTTKR
jgi:hypothetical protein